MKQYLFYSCSNKYERGPLELMKQILVRDDDSAESAQRNANDHEVHFKNNFKNKEYSSLYILVLSLSPQTGVTEVISNEYAENPLKTRIVINAAAKTAPPKRKTAAQMFADIMPSPTSVDMFEEHP